jgi:signal transduction histidine kinase
MDNLQKFTTEVRTRLVILLLASNLIIVLASWLGMTVFDLNPELLILLLLPTAIAVSILLAWVSVRRLVQPMSSVQQAVLHIAPDSANVPAPRLNPAALGAELVANIVSHVYQLASVVEGVERTAAGRHTDLKADFVANALPLPLIILDKNRNVLFANKPMLDYIARDAAGTIGQSLYSVLDVSFTNDKTLDKWLDNAIANEAVSSNVWERVRLNIPSNQTTKQFDLAAYYNRNNPEGFETMLVLFDHTTSYGRDDQALSFVALAVHELRTPITLLRGYIEALEEDLTGKIDPELAGFLHKMSAAAQGLTAFINNMLNVARIESNQLTLQLHEERWADIVQTAIEDVGIRAKVKGVELEATIADDLPPVGADRVGMYEVLVNLIDNAIKYSGDSKRVFINAYVTKDGMVETTVQDYGVGITTGVMDNLFEKFYRSHRSRGQVGGTGLGLYLCKTIVEAHGGHIWVRSKDGEGSTFGFTLVPYSNLAEEKKTGDNNDISRGAHGWIKNHSLYGG